MKRLVENPVLENPDYQFASDFAKRKHADTYAIRRNSGLPYFVHPQMVADVVLAYGGTEDEVTAAYLHDTLEDTDTTAAELETVFGSNVAQIVEEITNFEPDVKYYGKENYINHELLELSDSALFVKVADCVCNYLDNPSPGQAERIVRNLKYLIVNREDLPLKVKRLLKAIPELDEYWEVLDSRELVNYPIYVNEYC